MNKKSKKPKPRKRATSSRPSNRPKNTPQLARNDGKKSNFTKSTSHHKFLESPGWVGIAAIVAIVSLIWLVGFNFIDNNNRKNASKASIDVSHAFRQDAPGRWTIISNARNEGPAVADSLFMMYTATNALCISGEIVSNSGGGSDYIPDKGFNTGADCVGGVQLTGVVPATQDQLPGLFVKEFTSVAKATEVGLISGTINELRVGEIGWIEFEFNVAPDLEADLLKLISSERGDLTESNSVNKLLDSFNVPIFSGDKVAIRNVSYRMIKMPQTPVLETVD